MSADNAQSNQTNAPDNKSSFWEQHGRKVMIGAGAAAVGVAAGLAAYMIRNTGVGEAVEELTDAATDE